MKNDLLGSLVFLGVLLIGLAVIIGFITLTFVLIRALIRYIKSGDVRKEKSKIKKSLGEILKNTERKVR